MYYIWAIGGQNVRAAPVARFCTPFRGCWWKRDGEIGGVGAQGRGSAPLQVSCSHRVTTACTTCLCCYPPLPPATPAVWWKCSHLQTGNSLSICEERPLHSHITRNSGRSPCNLNGGGSHKNPGVGVCDGGQHGRANTWWDSDEKRKQRRQSLIAFSVINRVPHLMKH